MNGFEMRPEYKYANHIGWSDVNPFEIVRVVSAKCLEVREMKAERDPDWKPEFIPGGFAGHCVNQHEQRWNIEPDPEALVYRIRLHKNGWWKDANGNRFVLSEAPRKFYDYNF